MLNRSIWVYGIIAVSISAFHIVPMYLSFLGPWYPGGAFLILVATAILAFWMDAKKNVGFLQYVILQISLIASLSFMQGMIGGVIRFLQAKPWPESLKTGTQILDILIICVGIIVYIFSSRLPDTSGDED